jgi:uncharacterized protein
MMEQTKIFYKVHRQGPSIVLAAADSQVLGKKHQGGGRVLDLDKCAYFYKGEIADYPTLKSLFDDCTSANLVGDAIISLAIEHGVVNKEDIVEIGGVSHVQIFKMNL